MGIVLGTLKEQGIDEYMSCQDGNTAEIELDETSHLPRTFRVKNVNVDTLRRKSGSTCGRVAHALVEFACAQSDIESNMDIPRANCMQNAIDRLLEQFQGSVDVQRLKVPKSAEGICFCISKGFPVAAVLPVTEDIMERKVQCPPSAKATFAMMPVVIWGYSLVSRKFAISVPLHMYTEPTTVSFEHVLDAASCDLYVADIQVARDPLLDASDSEDDQQDEDAALFVSD